jgi:uncharacterized protein involved in outer membrane biogenesis
MRFRVLLVLVLVVVIAVAGGLFYLDRIVGASIERGASYALGVDTELRSVRLGLLSGEFSLSGLTVANPQGFEMPHFFRLERGDVGVRPFELTGDPIVVRELGLNGVKLSLERSKGRTNYGVILDNLSRLQAGAEASEPEDGEGAGFVIRQLIIRDVTAHARLAALGQKLTELDVHVPEIRLSDIGAGSAGGAPMAEVVGLVTRAILQAVAQRRGDLPADLTQELRGSLARLGSVRMEVPGSVSEAKEGLGREVQEKLESEAGKLLKGLGGRLRRDQRGSPER